MNAVRWVNDATKEQPCWFDKMGNVLNAMPKSVMAKATDHLNGIWQAEICANAEADLGFS